MMDKKHLAWLSSGKEPDLPKIGSKQSKELVKDLPAQETSKNKKLPEKPTKIVKPTKSEPVKTERTKTTSPRTAAKSQGTVTLKIPSLKGFPLWIVLGLIVTAGSLSVGIPTLASLDLTSLSSNAPPVNVDSKSFVVSRVRFDPTSTLTMEGATAVGASAVFTQTVKANFLAETGDIITISGINVQNLGSTNSIAAVEVIAPQGISVDVRSPAGAGNELRLLGTNTFALPIDSGSSSSPGSAEIQLRLIILTGPLDPTTSQQFSIEVGISALD